jgi:hypothetical protein
MDPSQRMRPGRGLVLVIDLTEPSDPAHGVQTLLKGCEAAVCSIEFAIVVRAPRIVLGFGACFNADE